MGASREAKRTLEVASKFLDVLLGTFDPGVVASMGERTDDCTAGDAIGDESTPNVLAELGRGCTSGDSESSRKSHNSMSSSLC